MLTNQTIFAFLKTVRADDTWDVIGECFDVLDLYQVEDYLSPIEMVYTGNDQLDDESRADLVVNRVKSILMEVLLQQGIVVREDIPLRKLRSLALAVYNITGYEDHQVLMDICLANETVIEKISQMISLVDNFTIEDCMGMIESVNQNSTEAIKSQLFIKTELSYDNTQYKGLMDNYSLWKGTTGLGYGVKHYSDMFTHSPDSVGLDFKIYFHVFLANYELPVDATPPEIKEVAKQLIAMALISGDGSKSPLVYIRAIIPRIFSDIKQATALDTDVSTLLIDFHRHIQPQ